MPELPEVETIARGLACAIAGKTIDAARVSLAKSVFPEPSRFERALAGERVVAVGRRGKYVVTAFASGRSLVTHLGMTGRLLFRPAGIDDPIPYSKVLIRFTDGSGLCFADVRRFGRMRLVEPEEVWAAEVGLEPLSEEFSVERFFALLVGRTTPMKVFLLDQRRIAGIGNIYACEALWEAGVKPSRPAGSIRRPACRRLHAAIQSVLRRAIAMRGTSIDDYVDIEGLRGGFQSRLSVYGREGQACPRCGKSIRRTILAQRGTWWCPGCQKI